MPTFASAEASAVPGRTFSSPPQPISGIQPMAIAKTNRVIDFDSLFVRQARIGAVALVVNIVPPSPTMVSFLPYRRITRSSPKGS